MNSMQRYGSAWIVGLAIMATSSAATIPTGVHFQGRLLDAGGQPVSGNRTFSVAMFADESGGTAVYSETVGAVPVMNGMYAFMFGTAAGFDAALRQAAWLELRVDGVPLAPRHRLLAVPYARWAGAVAEGVVGAPQLATASVESSKIMTGVIKDVHVSTIAQIRGTKIREGGTTERGTVRFAPHGGTDAWQAVQASDPRLDWENFLEPSTNTSIPVGPAMGDLEGTYPAPSIRVGAVNAAKIAPNAVLFSHFGEQAAENGHVIQWDAAAQAWVAGAGGFLHEAPLDGFFYGRQLGVWTALQEQDPIWSAVSNAVRTQAAQGATAHGWGNHALAGYAAATALNGVADRVTVIEAWPTASWNTAFGWGNHALAGYAAATALNGVADRVTVIEAWPTADWDTAFGWGNHALAGYAAATALAGVSDRVTVIEAWPTANWDTAFGWGNHAVAGYATAVALAGVSDRVTVIEAWPTADWDTAFGWGNHAVAGYATAVALAGVSDRVTVIEAWPTADWDAAFGWGNHALAGYAAAVALAGVSDRVTVIEAWPTANWDTAFGWGDHAAAGYQAAADHAAFVADTYQPATGALWTAVADRLPLAGGSMQGVLDMDGNDVVNAGDMTVLGDLGVGTNTPDYRLAVLGNVLLEGTAVVSTLRMTEGATEDFILASTADGTGVWRPMGALALEEVDPLWSAVSNTVTANAVLGAEAHGWGDHAPSVVAVSGRVDVIEAWPTADWDAAFGWGNHALAGYAAAAALDGVSDRVTVIEAWPTADWDTAFGWGDHAAAGYQAAADHAAFVADTYQPATGALWNAVADRLPLAGGSMQGVLDMDGHDVVNAGDMTVLGDLGVGTNTPDYRLAVLGNVLLEGTAVVSTLRMTEGAAEDYILASSADGTAAWKPMGALALEEVDPLWSAVSNTVTANAVLGAEAHGWGDHAASVAAVSGRVDTIEAWPTTDWTTAFGWGDHAPSVVAVSGRVDVIEAWPTADWTAAFNWGNHALAGYGSAASVVAVSGRVDTIEAWPTTDWTTAFGWGDHGPSVAVVSGRVDVIEGWPTANWTTAFGWGNHALAGYGSAASVAAVSGRVDTIEGWPTTDWDTAYGWGDHAPSVVAVSGRVDAIEAWPTNDWTTAFNWGNHALAGYGSAASVAAVSGRVDTIEAWPTTDWDTAYGWGDHAPSVVAVSGRVDVVEAWPTNDWTTAHGWGNHALAGYGSAASVAAVSGRVDTIEAWPTTDWDTAYGWGDHAPSVVAVSGRVDVVEAWPTNDWTTAFGWGNHALAGYGSAASVAAVSDRVDTVEAWPTNNWTTAHGWGNHATAGYLTDNATILKTGSTATTAGGLYMLTATGWIPPEATNSVTCRDLLGIAIGADSDADGMILGGFVAATNSTLVPGQRLFVSNETPGHYTATQPTNSKHIVRIIGYAISNDHFLFKPDNTYVEIR